MWQVIVTIAMVLLAAVYVVRRGLRRLRTGCEGGCACCPVDARPAGCAPAPRPPTAPGRGTDAPARFPPPGA